MNIGGVDVGTTGCKLSVYNEKGEFLKSFYREYDVSRANGEHEIDGATIFRAVCSVIRSGARECDIDSIGVTTFGETFVVLDCDDNVLLPSMLYTDPRGEKECKQLCELLGENKLISVSGVKPHPMYSLPKIMWIKNNMPDVYKKIKHILLMEDFIVYKLTGNAQIDYSLAARTMALDIRNKCWSDEIFSAADVDMSLMSKPVPTGTCAGAVLKSVAEDLGLKDGVKIVNGAHDQVASAVGCGVFEPGQAVDGTGTVECVTPVFDKIPENKQLYSEGYSVVPYVFDNTYVCYALSFTGGAVLKWYRDNFAGVESEIAKKNNENVFAYLDKNVPEKPTDILIMPHFAGAANPYMDSDSKAAIIGLTLEHTQNDLYKALMEGVTYEMMVNIEHLNMFGVKPEKLYATGGGATSEVWLQIKSDILNLPITALESKEVGACGTCMLAAVAMGIYDNLYEAKNAFVKYSNTVMPDAENKLIYKKQYNKYKQIYDMAKKIREED
ncbi:MAG: carbohydrate kinase [Clostridia bacterium]|nr:carbohydrate kinase [Clostridia bacterium]